MSGTSNVKHLCAAALCNLSDLKSVRPRMVEEGAIDVLTTLSRGAETRTRRVCAVILQNLSSAKSVRVAMASHNSVTAAFALSSDQDPIILRCVGLTLSRLAMEPSNCQKIIAESGITALCNIAVKYPTVPGISQPVAFAFQLLSSNRSARLDIVEEGSVTAIASLLRSSVDMFTLQHSLLALCNLLCEPQNHIKIVQQDLIQTLISMCNQENDLIRDFCSSAFLNLSVAEESRKHIVNAGAIVAIIAIAKQCPEATKRRCAAALCNISAYTMGMSRMVADGIISCIVNLVMTNDKLTVHYSCVALCRLCCTVENSKLMLESDAVPRLVRGAKEGDVETRQFCGAVLSSLSVYESCRDKLCEYGSISALKGLAKMNDDTTKQRCLVAFANLSCEEGIQSQMVEQGVVSIIAELANSYQEVNYICCAKAICNLAFTANTKLSVATEGGVHALLMISMVQSVDRLTKFLCVLGLNNLLDATTIGFMLEEGLVGSIANLSKIGDAHISNLCSKIYNHLTKFTEASVKITERNATLNALFRLAESNNVETQNVAIRTCCNLVLCNDAVKSVAIKVGVFSCLEKAITLTNEDTILQCLISTFSICSNEEYMEILSKNASYLSSLLKYAMKKDVSEVNYAYILKTLSMLAWSEKSRKFLQNKEFVVLVLKLIETNFFASSSDYVSALLRFIVIGYTKIDELIQLGISKSIIKIDENLNRQNSVANVSYKYLIEALRTLCMVDTAVEDVACTGALSLLKNGVVLCVEDSATMYNIAVLLYRFASCSVATRINSSSEDAFFVLNALHALPKCTELVAATLGVFLNDMKSRNPFLNEQSAKIIIKILEINKTENTIYNTILSIYALSRVSSCRGFLLSPHIAMDKLLNKYGSHESVRIKSNVTRCLKNLNSNPNEAIEEGVVANLIAMSLEGKLGNQISEEFATPSVLPLISKVTAPTWSEDTKNTASYINAKWFIEIDVKKGGHAGNGPEPPEIKVISIDGSTEYPNMTEELESNEIEGKTKMAFAKMQVPQVLKESFLFSDNDFVLHSNTTVTTSSTVTNDVNVVGDEVENFGGNNNSALKKETSVKSRKNSSAKPLLTTSVSSLNSGTNNNKQNLSKQNSTLRSMNNKKSLSTINNIEKENSLMESSGDYSSCTFDEDQQMIQDNINNFSTSKVSLSSTSFTSNNKQKQQQTNNGPESSSPNKNKRHPNNISSSKDNKTSASNKQQLKPIKKETSGISMSEEAARLGLYA